MKTVLSVVGARPNFMKVAPLHRALKAYDGRIRHVLVHTGQHYDERMSKVFFEELELPHPDVYLGVGSGSHAQQTAKVMVEFEKVLEQQRPDIVLVVGDVNSTLACTLVAAKMHVPVAHVEAGLRSFDREMPEEINRLVTDAIADLLLVSEPSGMTHLAHEGVAPEKVHLVGNTMIDSLVHYREKSRSSTIMHALGIARGEFMVVTLHRPSNVDDGGSLARILGFFDDFSHRVSAVFPVHPRTRRMLTDFGLMARAEAIPGLRLVDPLGYLDFLRLMEECRFVLTDSGGIQEETTYLGIPCLTLRDNTERPITVDVGTNTLCGADIAKARPYVEAILAGTYKKGRNPELWDGKAAERIAQILNSTLR